MRKYIVGIIIGLCLSLPLSIFANTNMEKIEAYINNDIKIEFNDEEIALKNRPINYKGSNYLPLRELSELIGLDVDWDDDTKTATLSNKLSNINKDINNNIDNGDKMTLNNDEVFYSFREVFNFVNNKFSVKSDIMYSTVKFIDGEPHVVVTYNGKENKVKTSGTTEYFYDLNTSIAYYTESFFLELFEPEDLEGLQKYTVDFENQTVTPID